MKLQDAVPWSMGAALGLAGVFFPMAVTHDGEPVHWLFSMLGGLAGFGWGFAQGMDAKFHLECAEQDRNRGSEVIAGERWHPFHDAWFSDDNTLHVSRDTVGDERWRWWYGGRNREGRTYLGGGYTDRDEAMAAAVEAWPRNKRRPRW